MNELQDCILGDLVEFQRGYDLPKDAFVKGEYPVQSSNGILGYHNEYKVKAPGITIGRSGTVGIPHLITKNFFPHNTALYVKDFKGNNVQYIYYLLKNLKLNEYKTGSGVPTMNRNHLHPLKIRAFTNLKTQQSIAAVLSALDKKIALNKQINARLEEMAKTLYDYWFVQFDFPDAEGKPYKSSGGEMVFDETLKREIPKGWEVKSLGNLAEIVGGSTPSTADSDNFCSNGTAWITPYDLSKNQDNKFISHGEIDVSEKGIKNASLKKYPTGTVLMSSRAPIGYMAIARNEVTTNQGFKSFIPNKGFSKEFVFYAVKNSLKSIMQSASGSTFKEVSATTLHSIQAVFPKHELVEKYTERSKKIFKIQDNLEKQNHQLTQLRNFLLPMLMNGQVMVQDV